MSAQPSLTVTKDFTKTFKETVSRFKRDAVLVGIPEEDNAREAIEGEGPINNAAILALNHFGSDKNNIPPRPVLTIGIRKAQDAIAEEMKKAAQQALAKGANVLETYYNRAGTLAANSCKKVINDQEDIAPPAESTLRARKYLTKSGFKGEKALLVTGQTRNAITHVVNTKWGK